jgi:hypothetical protein
MFRHLLAGSLRYATDPDASYHSAEDENGSEDISITPYNRDIALQHNHPHQTVSNQGGVQNIPALGPLAIRAVNYNFRYSNMRADLRKAPSPTGLMDENPYNQHC